MIHFSSSFSEFLRKKRETSRIAKVLWNAWRDPVPAYRLMVTTEQINYLTFRNDGQISYLPAGKEHLVNEDETWKREGRQEGKAAKVIRKLFTSKALKLFKDKDFEIFSTSYSAEFSCAGYSFTERPNWEIKEVYDMEIWDSGRLGNSCMNGKSEELDIYECCEALSILTLTDKSGRLCGRALIWKISNDITFMDRIYTSVDWLDELFIEYAKKNKYWRKKHYTTFDHKTQMISPDGEEIRCEWKIKTCTDFDKYPYIDTFQSGDDGSLNNFGAGPYEYNNTDGTREGDEDEHEGEVYDEIAEEWIDEDNAVMIDRGQYSGYYTHMKNTVTTHDGYVYWHESDDVVYLDYLNEYFEIEDTVYSEPENKYILIKGAVEINGAWYLLSTEGGQFVKIEGTYYLMEDVEEDEDGNYKVKEVINA